MFTRIPFPLFVSVLLVSLLAAGCQKNSGPDLTAEVQRLTAELEAAHDRVNALETAATTARANAPAASSADAPKTAPAPPEETAAPAPAPRAQPQSPQDELAAKKRDALSYAEASAALQNSATIVALDRYQQFIREFPDSPLVADASRAITELNNIVQRESRARINLIDPRRPEREILQRFNDAAATVPEIAVLVKNRSQADVVKLLGQPNQTYRDGREIGYTDKVIDLTTGNKETLVIGFESDVVTTLRAGYLGKPVKP